MEVIQAQLCMGIVDPHHKFFTRITNRIEGLENQKAGAVFLVYGNRIFQIKHDAIGIIDARVLNHGGVVSRHV